MQRDRVKAKITSGQGLGLARMTSDERKHDEGEWEKLEQKRLLLVVVLLLLLWLLLDFAGAIS